MPKSPQPIPNLTDEEVLEFWSKVDRSNPDGCWPWAALTTHGYGIFYVGRPGAYRNLRAHRVSYLLASGRDPGRLLVCHRCDNPPCCNPAHLFLGTHLENMHDCQMKGRLVIDTKKPRGEQHWRNKLTPAQVREIRAVYAAGLATQRELGRRYGVSQGTIGPIVRREIWTHIPESENSNATISTAITDARD